jgi:nucleoside-diphosphate-sugar epimerase
MIKKVLVVGGAGYIGGAVTDFLLERGIKFTVYDNLTYENHYLKPGEFIYGDVRDKNKLKKTLKRFSHVIWLAAIVGDGASQINPILTRDVNENSVRFMSQNYNGRIIFTSTCSVYGATKDISSETSKTNPLSLYAETKLSAEKILLKKNALIFRLGTAFGISDSYSRIRMDLALNYMTMNAIKKRELTVFGGNQWRPFIHVRDIARFIVDNLDTKHKGIYNLSTQNSTIFNLAKIIKKNTQCKILKSHEKFQDQRSYHVNLDKAKKAGILDGKEILSLDFGVKEIKDLVNSKRVRNLNFEAYSNEQALIRFIISERGHL